MSLGCPERRGARGAGGEGGSRARVGWALDEQGGLAGEAGVRRGPPRQGGRTHHRAHVSCFSLLP